VKCFYLPAVFMTVLSTMLIKFRLFKMNMDNNSRTLLMLLQHWSL